MLKYAVVFFISLTLVSCSKIDLAVDYAPRMATNFLDHYLDFSSERFDRVKESLAGDLKNSKFELRDQFVKKIDQVLPWVEQKEIKETDLADIFFGMRKLQNESAQSFKKSFDEIFLNMTDAEFSHFKNETGKNLAKYEELLKEPEKFKQKAVKGFERNMKILFDSVEDNQKQLYIEFIDKNYDFYKAQAEFRRQFLETLEKKSKSRMELRDLAFKFYSADDSIKTEEYRKKQDFFFQNMFSTTRKIWSTLTEAQKKEFRSTLLEIKSDLQSLK